jgi:L-lactate dehydrogenase complex protein LldF
MTPSVFRQRISQSIANSGLQIALDNNAERRVKGWLAAFATLPDSRERRQRAHAVRADVIAHLDQYLEKFTAKVIQNGTIIHIAQDANEAVKIVSEIADNSIRKSRSSNENQEESKIPSGSNLIQADPQKSGTALLIAKSKSMISEEIGLNHSLEAHGHRVIETDLGEYIVQLRGEKPAHIITPAVHLRRNDVGKLFQEKFGIPYTEEVSTLTATAHKVLREVFLTADIGISGVNFGVAETGTFCIVTNEGNGRMVTTVPKVHIALMGMERLVPTLADLALMLSLLARSATGQKLSVYTQLINSPRRSTEIDGAQERHLIILDNGRSRLRNSSLFEALYCIRCGACLNACPVFRELGGHAYVGTDGSIAPYSGPIGSIVSPGLLGLEQFGQLAQASSLCGACKDACPVDIDLPKLLTRVRAGGSKITIRKEAIGLTYQSKVGLQIYGIIGSSPKLFSIAQTLAGLGSAIVFPFTKWIKLPGFTGWGYSKDFPRPSIKPFRARFQSGASVPIVGIKSEEIPGKEPPDDQLVGGINENLLLIERFTQELEAIGGHPHRVSKENLIKTLTGDLKEHGIEEALIWEKIPALEEAGLTKSGISLFYNADPLIRAGITGAAAGIAETGTLVISSGQGKPMSTSLLPEIHLVVIKSAQIVSTLEEALQLENVREASATTLITGPSRTADIEMTLTIGMHGPKELIVYIVDE